MEDFKIVFMGTPEFAAKSLKAIYNTGFKVSGVVTQPDRKTGRGQLTNKSEVKVLSEKLELPTYQPGNKQELTEIISKLKPDLIIVAAYGMIIPESVLEIPNFKTLNIHGSLLPKYRGASCINEAILNDDITGVTIMEVTPEMDKGAIISQVEVEITKDDTKETLEKKLAEAGAKEIVRVIPLWIKGELKAEPQEETEATYCKLIKKEDGKIDWTRPAEYIERMTRAYYPWPTAFTFLDGKMLKIISAKVINKTLKPGEILAENGQMFVGTGDKTLEVLKLQPENKKEMSSKEFLNGQRDINTKFLS